MEIASNIYLILSIFQILFPVFYIHCLFLSSQFYQVEQMKKLKLIYPKLISDKLELYRSVRWQLLFPHCATKAFLEFSVTTGIAKLYYESCITIMYVTSLRCQHLKHVEYIYMRHIMAEITIASYQSRFLNYKSKLPCIKTFNIQNHREMRDTVSLQIPFLQFTISRHLIRSFDLLFLKNG